MKKIKGHFWYSVPPDPIKLGLRPRRKACGAGPRREFIGAYCRKLKTSASMIFKITPCKCELLDPKIEKSPICWKFEIFEKIVEFSKHHYRRDKKKTTFGTKYLKTHVNMVISKMMLPQPQLDIKF